MNQVKNSCIEALLLYLCPELTEDWVDQWKMVGRVKDRKKKVEIFVIVFISV